MQYSEAFHQNMVSYNHWVTLENMLLQILDSLFNALKSICCASCDSIMYEMKQTKNWSFMLKNDHLMII